MKKVKLILVAIVMIASNVLTAQVTINTDGSNRDASAMLDVKSTDKGFLPPRVAKVSDVSNPVAGLMVFEEFNHCMRFYNGSEWSDCMGGKFTCGGTITDADGNTYNTVQIGNQCWMAENLNIGTMITTVTQNDNGTIEKFCYSNIASNCDTYGGLYQWDEMMQYVTTEGTQGICPTGWHLPTDAEYKTMEMQLGMTQAQADATSWRGTDESSQMAGNEPLWTNGLLDQNVNFGSSSLNVLPAGYYTLYGVFQNINLRAYLWSSSEYDANTLYAWPRLLAYDETRVYRHWVYKKTNGYSVRCVRD